MDRRQLQSPLGKIAMSLSGGGYRATVFHLGSMSYLNSLKFKDKPLLQNVEMISTVSGGTITGVVYALGVAQGKSFETIYEDLREQLAKVDLLKDGFKMLGGERKWSNDLKSRNLINAFALQYDKAFTDGKTLADLGQLQKTHLKRAVFNSTEFNNAINFRFKTISDDQSGNFYNKIPSKDRPLIKLSDIIASSSCFPGGFEPMLWPADYRYDTISENHFFSPEKKQTGIMDGGIYDNQGIESILNYKSDDKPYFDLVIISDVASPNMTPWQPMEPPKKVSSWKKMTLKAFGKRVRAIKNWGLGVIAATIVGLNIYPIINGYDDSALTGVLVTLSISLGLLAIAILALYAWAFKTWRKFLESLKNGKLKFYLEKMEGLKIEDISIVALEPLIANRVTSLMTLMIDVFLKVVRRLNYDKLYEDGDYVYRRISNLVRELTEKDYKVQLNREKQLQEESTASGKLRGHYADAVGPKIKEVAEAAADFGTTLWFTETEVTAGMLDKLTASGQFTMCYNMILYLEKVIYDPKSGFSAFNQATQQELMILYDQCWLDWLAFKNDPMRMVNTQG